MPLAKIQPVRLALLNRIDAFNRKGGYRSGDAFYLQDQCGPFGFRSATSAPADCFFIRNTPWEIERFTWVDTAIVRSRRDRTRTAEVPMWKLRMHVDAGLEVI